MKSPYVSELQPNQTVTATFLVHLKDVRQKKTGEPYLSLVLGDRTGELDAKMWDNVTEVLEIFERDDFVKVKGLVQIHRNQPQLQIHKLSKMREVDLELADFFPSSERSSDAMFAELVQTAAGIRNPHLKALLDRVLADEPLMRLYRLAPAAKSVHHAFLGGLLEHVLSLCHLAKMTAAHYPFVDLDLLLTGVVLHDVGKVVELTYDRSFGYSSEGQLLGHIVIGLRMLNDKLAGLPDFPPRLRTLVEHLIVSHHGELEYGSPKVPLFPEAMLLHHLDNMDSKMECMRSMLAKDRHATGAWTSYNSALDRAVLKMARFLDGEAVPTPSLPPPPNVPIPPPHVEPIAAKPMPIMPAAPVPLVPNGRPMPIAPAPVHSRPQPASVFAEKLKDAWKK